VLSGLRIKELQIGDGAVALRGASVTVRNSGSLNRGEPFQANVVATFAVGERNTIAGLVWGVRGDACRRAPATLCGSTLGVPGEGRAEPDPAECEGGVRG
jgi:hypothetical protein